MPAPATPAAAPAPAASASSLGCVVADFPSTWRRGSQREIAGWVREAVPGPDGTPVYPFASFVPIPADVDPIAAFTSASESLRESKLLRGGGRDYSLKNSLGRRGFSADDSQRDRDHLIYVLLVDCQGSAELVMLDTTRDTEAQVDGEFRRIIASLRPAAAADR